jgi:hypothetical protein
MTSFFNLCADVLLHLFTYFSLNELFDIFADMIPNLSTLLIEGHAKLYVGKNANDQFWNDFLPEFNLNQIIALHISYSKINEINLSKFSSLRSITFESVQMMNSLSSHSINQFHHLTHLKRLSLKLSDRVLSGDTWLPHILRLSTLKQLKIELMVQKNTILSQRDISKSQLSFQSSTIEYLELKIPLLWASIISLLHHFPYLQNFRAYLYRIYSNPNDTLISIPNLSCFHSLKKLNLTGYFFQISSIITFFCSSIPDLNSCRLMSTSVTNDDIFYMTMLGYGSFWKHLFQPCRHLKQVKLHILMSIEQKTSIDIEYIKNLIHFFNDDAFCKQHDLYIIQSSIHNGYITLTCNFNKQKRLNLEFDRNVLNCN